MSESSSSEKVIRRLYEITNNYSNGLDAQIQGLLKLGCERFKLDIGIFSHIEGEDYTVLQVQRPDHIELNAGDSFPLLNTYCQITCQSDKPVMIDRMSKSDELAQHPAYRNFGLESYIGVPIYIEGNLYGTLNFSSHKPYKRQFNGSDVDALQLMASWISVELRRHQHETELKKLNRELEKLALFDPLTKLPNRHSLLDVVPKSIRRLAFDKTEGALALIDIDHFKLVNDSFGHLFGDKILVKTADSIADAIREIDLIARFGGEEFVVWLPRTNKNDIMKICDRIMSSVSKIKSGTSTITVSIGVCFFEFSDSKVNDPKSLLDDFILTADNALYEAKAKGRNRVCVANHKFSQRPSA
ncbi:GGDEF family protein [Vibrio nigripulchritudo MADA3029]|uniref:sensor domain-containing diguanylate cyclase n=1 Tax=Vibrio nigripulchritudo TaxID=28173 RepID=UPI0003B205AB|nr:sensor domain-containing diguanylate cyclase [Vibrio nigripulchritudo]CCN45889.1 GGDEF family protein [Vibrio nigripulchritudo MADA3020]CCN56060.1 GGDEF family protein [Vibrio nigripulchritudo MADA3021]CCN59803.1 GGDEF family protein [Vibrio nigripulchritudo MADA3029]